MESLHEIRQAYDDNYAEICGLIEKMGGDEHIKFHRKKKSNLFVRLLELQKFEHYLDELENQYHQPFAH